MNDFSDIIISAPIDLLENELHTNTAYGSRAQMFTHLENGSISHMTGYDVLPVKLLGPPRALRRGDVLISLPLVWEIVSEFVCHGIRVFGGEVEGQPWDSYAHFNRPPLLKPGYRLTISYKIHAE